MEQWRKLIERHMGAIAKDDEQEEYLRQWLKKGCPPPPEETDKQGTGDADAGDEAAR